MDRGGSDYLTGRMVIGAGARVDGPTYREQEMSVWNGHCVCTCCHSPLASNRLSRREQP